MLSGLCHYWMEKEITKVGKRKIQRGNINQVISGTWGMLSGLCHYWDGKGNNESRKAQVLEWKRRSSENSSPQNNIKPSFPKDAQSRPNQRNLLCFYHLFIARRRRTFNILFLSEQSSRGFLVSRILPRNLYIHHSAVNLDLSALPSSL